MEAQVKQIVKKRSISKRKKEKALKNRSLFIKGICPTCGSSGLGIWKRGPYYECENCR